MTNLELCNTIVYMLIRTQILLDQETKRDLEYISQMTSESISSLVRRFVAEKVAEIWGTDKDAMENKLFQNTLQVFNRIGGA